MINAEYPRPALSEVEVDPDPFVQFRRWHDQAVAEEGEGASAMVLTTVNAAGIPSARMVLLKDLTEDGFVFFTNYSSRKGKEIGMNRHVALLFYWKEVERQVRVVGKAVKVPREKSEGYFDSRPLESRISAIVSPQSQPVPGREWLEKRWREANRLALREKPVLPANWGGFCVQPDEFEFFQGREHRLHDRIQYIREEDRWLIRRLAP